jgi:hypothetical protein
LFRDGLGLQLFDVLLQFGGLDLFPTDVAGFNVAPGD